MNANKTTPQDFVKGQVYKMLVADRSHVKEPYYIVIKTVGKDRIVTTIPGHHDLHIVFGSFEWQYHISRMEYIGIGLEVEQKYLFKQKALSRGY